MGEKKHRDLFGEVTWSNSVKEWRYTYAPSFVYFLVDVGIVVYVGQTKNIWSRILTHQRDKEFGSIYYIQVMDIDGPLEIERLFIKLLRPTLNAMPPEDLTELDERVLRKYLGDSSVRRIKSKITRFKNGIA